MMQPRSSGLLVEQDEIKGFARTIAEIEWLLLILVLVYLVAVGQHGDGEIALHMALFFLGAFILALHYVHFYRKETRAKLALETWIMVVFVTWVAWYSGKIESPLLNLYLLPIIASALILGKVMTAIQIAVITGCYMVMASGGTTPSITTLAYWGMIFALVVPVVLVAYITTMLSADIRYAVAKLKQVTDTDELTGAYNMRAFNAMLERAYQQAVRHRQPLSVIMLDSDNLKAINDAHGHAVGNRLLQHLVRKVGEEMRRSDIVARFGGDEFIVLLPQTNRKGAIGTAERIRKSIESSRFDARGVELAVTVSIGVANYPEDGSNIDMVVDKADKALYRAKGNGRNNVTAYEIQEEAAA